MSNKGAVHLIDKAIDTGVNIRLRRIYLFGEIDNELSHRFIAALDALNAAGPERITVVMNSIGGSVYDGLAIYDAIKASRSMVEVIVAGQCFSMAAVILQAAAFRTSYPSSSFMTHDGQDKFEGHTRNYEAWAAESKRVRRYMYDILASRTHRDHKYWARTCTVDKLFTATEALDIGLIDEVIE